jgi:hypothetical protein
VSLADHFAPGRNSQTSPAHVELTMPLSILDQVRSKLYYSGIPDANGPGFRA